jgi:lipopolysaccharide transport protein LptA
MPTSLQPLKNAPHFGVCSALIGIALMSVLGGCSSAHAVPYKGFLDKGREKPAHSDHHDADALAQAQDPAPREGAGAADAQPPQPDSKPQGENAAGQASGLPTLNVPAGAKKRAALRCDRLKLKPDGVALCTGRVRMWREDVEVTCDQATATFDDKEQLKSLICTGRVKIVTPDKVAHSGRAVYDDVKQTLTLSEKARLRQRGIHLQGETLVVNLATNEVEVEGDVQGLFDARESDGK